MIAGWYPHLRGKGQQGQLGRSVEAFRLSPDPYPRQWSRSPTVSPAPPLRAEGELDRLRIACRRLTRRGPKKYPASSMTPAITARAHCDRPARQRVDRAAEMEHARARHHDQEVAARSLWPRWACPGTGASCGMSAHPPSYRGPDAIASSKAVRLAGMSSPGQEQAQSRIIFASAGARRPGSW